MTYYSLTPAYGRDYRTAKEAKEAFNSGKDFEGDYNCNFQLVNKEQLTRPCTVNIRFAKQAKIAQVKL